MGPYTKSSVAVQPWSHNPQMVKSTDGYFLIFTLGDGVPGPHGPEKDCRGTSESQLPSPNAESSNADSTTVPFVIHASKSLDGPWEAFPANITNFKSTWNMNNWNPAPLMYPDGSVRVMVHTDPAPWAGMAIATASHWRGPYRIITGAGRMCTCH